MRKLKWTTILGFTLAVVGIILIIFFSFSKAFNDGSGTLNPSLANSFGGFIGGLVGPIFSLAGFFLLYETILAQKETLDKQQASFEIQQFETKFFELIKFHRDNVSQMTHRVAWDENTFYDKGRVFVEMKSQFNKIYYVTRLHVNNSKEISDTDKEHASINISYLILFFGVAKATRTDLEHFFQKYGYSKELTEPIVNKLYLEKTKYNINFVYYGGHQVRLGHYFRHLFQTVKFVHNTQFLTARQKYEYIKILRAQLTQHELAIFFVNSLSIGQEWEKNKFITTYKFIKNLPKNSIANLNPKNYYGGFKYEWEK